MLTPNRDAQFKALSGLASNIAIGAAGTEVLQIKNNAGGDFYMRRLKAVARINAASGAALARTPLASAPSPTLASNTFYSNSQVTVNFKIGSTFFFSQEISLTALMGEEGEGFWFSDVLPKLDSTQTLDVTVSNSTGVAIDLEIFAPGFVVPKGAPALVEA